MLLTTLSAKIYDTIVTLSLSKGLVFHSLSEESAKSEILHFTSVPFRMTWLIFYLTLYQPHVQKLAPLAKW